MTAKNIKLTPTFEFKYNSDKAKLPKIFSTTYQDSSFKMVNQKNVFDLLE